MDRDRQISVWKRGRGRGEKEEDALIKIISKRQYISPKFYKFTFIAIIVTVKGTRVQRTIGSFCRSDWYVSYGTNQ